MIRYVSATGITQCIKPNQCQKLFCKKHLSSYCLHPMMMVVQVSISCWNTATAIIF